jgi:hypothetical protein
MMIKSCCECNKEIDLDIEGYSFLKNRNLYFCCALKNICIWQFCKENESYGNEVELYPPKEDKIDDTDTP